MSPVPPAIRQLGASLAVLAWGLIPLAPKSGTIARIDLALRNDLLNNADYERMERGYYERLLDAGRSPGTLDATSRVRETRRDPVPVSASALTEAVPDVREFVLKPSFTIRHATGRWTTNSLGMRDREYEAVPPPGTLRIGLAGDSIAAGWGVDDAEGFEPTWERLLIERSRRLGTPPVEVLNFAVPGHGPGQRWEHFSRVGWERRPDLVIFEATLADSGWDERRLRGLLPRGVGWDCRLYRGSLAASGARPGGTPETYKRALKPYRRALLEEVYRTAAADCRARRVPCVWVLVPRVGKASEPGERERLLELARASGFTAVVDLSDTYDGLDPVALAVAPDDYHPNAEGHARLARRLDEALRREPALRPFWESLALAPARDP